MINSDTTAGSLRVSKSCKYPWYCTLTFLEQKGTLKLYYSDGTEVANEYTKIVTANLAWVNLGVNNAERMRVLNQAFLVVVVVVVVVLLFCYYYILSVYL